MYFTLQKLFCNAKLIFFWFLTLVVLPAGTTRSDDNQKEEVVIPITQKTDALTFEKVILSNNKKVVFIDMIDSWARQAFKGYTRLNRVQSIVYPVVYGTNENILVCAPTGAGKTDIAMLSVLRCISQHKDSNIRLDAFKIVYVAPMKALAAEVILI